jgi:hypothetical protein
VDAILYWNDVALEANRVSHTNGKNEQTGPTLSSRALAIVHLAMYDALAGVVNDPTNLPPYLTGLPSPAAGASEKAAVAAAAHATLSKLFPSQKPYFDLRHAQASLGGAGLTEGHQFGRAVAQVISTIGRTIRTRATTGTQHPWRVERTGPTPTTPTRAIMPHSTALSPSALPSPFGTSSMSRQGPLIPATLMTLST